MSKTETSRTETSRTEIRIGGLGGQGVILCGMVIGKAASIYDGKNATLIQSFGPEARGSACSAQVIVAEGPIDYPYVRQPDVLVLLSRDAYAQFIDQLKPGGLLLYESDLIAPDERLPARARAHGIPATRFAEELGRRLVLNIVMAGFFTGVTGLVPIDTVEKAVRDSVPRGTEDLNLRALRKGYAFGLELVGKGQRSGVA
ncbi:MAG: 2-oxoacid:acceptor oxidoreductase family protein [Planctomycetes bacterium]|nr:2-oxoacid:acceptor oxidoreductase family protein [Planctomycetota bacterium]